MTILSETQIVLFLVTLSSLISTNHRMNYTDDDKLALELLAMNNVYEEFDIVLDYDHIDLGLLSKTKLFYVCPAETDIQKKLNQQKQYSHCLHIKNISKKILTSVTCENSLQPYFSKFYNFELGCGVGWKGRRYGFQYLICWNENPFINNLLKISHKSPVTETKNVITKSLEIYTICLLNEQPLYARYYLNVVSPKSNEPSTSYQMTNTDSMSRPLLESYSRHEYYDESPEYSELASKTIGEMRGLIDLENVANLYHVYQQINFGSESRGYDGLVPQMLVSPKHIKSAYARRTPYSYVNVRPMWFSLQKKWNRLDDFIEKLGLNRSYEIQIFVGINGIYEENHEKIIMRFDDNPAEIKVPSTWWKLLINKDKYSILLAMQNTPIYATTAIAKLCRESICDLYGWNDVNEPKDNAIYCCQLTEELKVELSLNGESFDVGNIFSLKPEHQKDKFFWGKILWWSRQR